MRVSLQPSFRKERISLDVNYNETIENILVQCTLQVTEVPITELTVYFQDKAVSGQKRLDEIGAGDGAVLELRQRQETCCALL